MILCNTFKIEVTCQGGSFCTEEQYNAFEILYWRSLVLESLLNKCSPFKLPKATPRKLLVSGHERKLITHAQYNHF